MIYLKKESGAKVTTNDEDVAKSFEADGYVRIRGWQRVVLISGQAIKEVVLEWFIPVAVGLALFHFCDGRDYAAFVLGAYTLTIIRGLFSD